MGKQIANTYAADASWGQTKIQLLPEIFVHLYEVHAPLAFYRLRSNVDLFEFFLKRTKFHFGRPKYLG